MVLRPPTRYFNCLRPAVLCLLTGLTLQPGFAQPLPARAKKLIATGWDNPSPAFLRQNLATMEQCPFDGVDVTLTGVAPDGKNYPMNFAFQAGNWQRAWFQQNLDDLQACHFQRFTDNFVNLSANPGTVDWFDDAGWHDVVEHWRIAAWIVREAHLKGIVFDCEGYSPPYRQFEYKLQAGHAGHSFNEYYAKARQRGQEVMQAIAEIDPGITIFSYRMNSVNRPAVGHPDARDMLATFDYGLLAPFISGWLDSAPPTVKFVDGCEDTYLANSDLEYLRFSNLVKVQLVDLVPPEDRAKYQSQVEVGFGCYLDAYINPQTARYHMPPLTGGTPADQLETNIETALRLSDEYVWIYGEHHRWWLLRPTDKVQTWPEAFPGIVQALGYAAHPTETARQEVGEARAAGTLQNLARNGDFSAGPDAKAVIIDAAPDWTTAGAPAQWSTWQDNGSHGTFGWDAKGGVAGGGAARASGVKNGCFTEVLPVEPGQYYAVSVLTRLQGSGKTLMSVGWKSPQGKWLPPYLNITPLAKDDLGVAGANWQRIFGTAHVPPGAGELIFVLDVDGQNSPADTAWFDNAAVYRLR